MCVRVCALFTLRVIVTQRGKATQQTEIQSPVQGPGLIVEAFRGVGPGYLRDPPTPTLNFPSSRVPWEQCNVQRRAGSSKPGPELAL